MISNFEKPQILQPYKSIGFTFFSNKSYWNFTDKLNKRPYGILQISWINCLFLNFIHSYHCFIRHGPFDILGGGGGGLEFFRKKFPCSDFDLKKIILLNGTVKKIIRLQWCNQNSLIGIAKIASLARNLINKFKLY